MKKENGITIETPSYTMEIAERLREVSTGDWVGEEMQSQHFVLLEKVVTLSERFLKPVKKLSRKVSSKLSEMSSDKNLQKTF